MVSTTFMNLSPEKQARVKQALLHEFETYPLAQAQVARIVKEADIARGAFYKYFTDLNDAYQYLFKSALQTIHQTMPTQPTALNVDEYVSAIRHFTCSAELSGYRQLVEMHYRYNENFLGAKPTTPTNDKKWAFKVLYHQTVRDVILDPSSLEQRIGQLKQILQSLSD